MSNWTEKNNYLQKKFKFTDYAHAVEFANRVFRLCKNQNHHADVLVRYDSVEIRTTTHDQGKLTEKDFTLVKEIDFIGKEDSLR